MIFPGITLFIPKVRLVIYIKVEEKSTEHIPCFSSIFVLNNWLIFPSLLPVRPNSLRFYISLCLHIESCAFLKAKNTCKDTFPLLEIF